MDIQREDGYVAEEWPLQKKSVDLGALAGRTLWSPEEARAYVGKTHMSVQEGFLRE